MPRICRKETKEYRDHRAHVERVSGFTWLLPEHINSVLWLRGDGKSYEEISRFMLLVFRLSRDPRDWNSVGIAFGGRKIANA